MNSTEFVIAIAFTTSMIMLVVGAFAFHLIISGRKLQQTQDKLKALAAILSETEERERRRIAEDLHARVGEILAASARKLEELMKQSPSAEFRSELGGLRQDLGELKKGASNLIFDLTPRVLYDIGFVEGVEDMAADLGKRLRVTMSVENQLQTHPPSSEIATFLFKAIKEFTQNAVNHGGADEILVTLRNGHDTIEAIVEDNGTGFAPGSSDLLLKKDSGFGLFNVKTRAEYYTGGLRLAASTNLGGALVSVWTPTVLPEAK